MLVAVEMIGGQTGLAHAVDLCRQLPPRALAVEIAGGEKPAQMCLPGKFPGFVGEAGDDAGQRPPLGEIEVNPQRHSQAQGLAGRLGEMRAVGHKRDTGDDPLFETAENPPVPLRPAPQIIGIDNQLNHLSTYPRQYIGGNTLTRKARSRQCQSRPAPFPHPTGPLPGRGYD